jgi:hypothetical protein
VHGSLSGGGLTLAIVRDRARHRCVERGWSAGRDSSEFRELSVAVLEDSLSEPGASHDGLDPHSAPESVSVSDCDITGVLTYDVHDG